MSEQYYPPPESQGGWRFLETPEEIRERGGFDPGKLEPIRARAEADTANSWALVIIRNGYLVAEITTASVHAATRFDIWSCSKSFTGIAFGVMLDDARRGRLVGGRAIELDSFAYDYIPDGFPLSDPRKARITVRQLLSMTSGIPGEDAGLYGNRTPIGEGLFEHALGRGANRNGLSAAQLLAEPGALWDYSDPAFAHLSMIITNVTDQQLDEYMSERVFKPIGLEQATWDRQGGGPQLGPYTNPHTGLHLSARDLARAGYLLLRRGLWDGKQLVADWWIDLATSRSQELNPAYGLTFWVNTDRRGWWPSLPPDAFSFSGFRFNRCYVIPSLDLVVARIGTGPAAWEAEDVVAQDNLIAEITDAAL